MNTNLITLDAEQISMMYAPTFTKKDAIQTGKELVSAVFEDGELDPLKVYSNIVRLKEVVNSADEAFRSRLNLSEPDSANGVSFKQNNGAEKLNYSEDPEIAKLEAKLKDRKELVKLATKSKDVIFDSDGIEVTKVSSTYNKSSITVTF